MPLGIITRTTLGLILSENFEQYPNGWTLGGTGTGQRVSRAHAGSYALMQETDKLAWSNWPNGWANAASNSVTKSVNVQSGANRVAKVFRALGIVGILYDDFPTNTMDTNKWDPDAAPPAPTISNGVVTVGREFRTYGKTRFRQPVRLAAKIKVGKTGSDPVRFRLETDDSNTIWLHFNKNGDGHLVLRFKKYGSETLVDAGVYDTTAYHIYSIEWLSGSAKVYKDGSLLATETTNNPVDEAGYNYYCEFLREGSSTLEIDWVALENATGVPAGMWKASLKVGSSTLFDVDALAESASLDNGFYDEGWQAIPSGTTGTQTVELKIRNASGQRAYVSAQHLWDDLIIMLGSSLTIQGLATGQKVEMYDSGGTLKATVTKNGGDPTITMTSLIKNADGFLGYFKVYDINGTTLLHTSATTQLWGGDIWLWSSQTSRIWIPAGSYRIYKQGAVAEPKTLTVDMFLKWLADDTPIQNKLISFSASQGTVSPSSAASDSNGKVTVTLTSGASMGWAILKANWAGDGDVSPAKAYLEVATYDEADAGDSALPYQLFVQGRAYDFTTGTYKKATSFAAQSFEIELPQVEPTIDGAYEVIIYRRGVKDFVGRIRKITKTIDNRMILNGVSDHWKLGRRVVDSPKSYNLEPKSILEDLLTRFACGVSEGNIGIYGSPVQIPFDYDTITAALKRLLDATGWQARLNLDDSFDFAVDFGNHSAVEFKTGESNVALQHELDFDPVDTRTILIGDPSTLVSDLDDATAAATQGLVEEVFFDKNVTAQATLDAENMNILDLKKQPVERVSGNVIDLSLDVNVYDVFDYVTITDPVTGTAGEYRVVSIERNMTDQGFAILEIGNAQRRLGDLVAALRGKVKDLSA